jgi:glycosyltransferase involved in cell wall biosynthesis
MLEESLEFLEKRRVSSNNPFKYEIIIVDDGSKDGTSKVTSFTQFLIKSELNCFDLKRSV